MSEKEFLFNFACVELSHAKKMRDEAKEKLHDADMLVEAAKKHLEEALCADETH